MKTAAGFKKDLGVNTGQRDHTQLKPMKLSEVKRNLIFQKALPLLSAVGLFIASSGEAGTNQCQKGLLG